MPSRDAPLCLTIGNFDGLHRGHLFLIHSARDMARDKSLAFSIMTFWPHPRAVLRGPQAHQPLVEHGDKLRMLSAEASGRLIEIPFTRVLAGLDPERFVVGHLLPLGLSALVIGHDFTLGRERGGDFAALRALGEKYGFSVARMPAFEINGEPVSSTRLRGSIKAGDMETARQMLGRFYRIKGTVAHGFGRGAGLGFPTANLENIATLIPGNGVYAVFAHVNGHVYPGITNIGKNPTFGNDRTTVETFIMAEPGYIYGKPLELEFVAFLRHERKFDSPDALKAQIARDMEQAGAILARDDNEDA